MKRTACLFFLATLALASLLTGGGCGDHETTAPSVIFSTAGGDVTLRVEVADTPDERTTGLMGRKQLAADEGMIFVFESPARGGFWMKNTLVPLSIAFVDESDVIIDIQDMEPQSLASHAPPSPYLLAIEVNQGYFRQHGIVIGDRVETRLYP